MTTKVKRQAPTSANSRALNRLQFIRLFLEGATIARASEAATVTPRTGSNWLAEWRKLFAEFLAGSTEWDCSDEDLLEIAAELEARLDMGYAALDTSTRGRSTALDRIRLLTFREHNYTLRRAADISGVSYQTARNWTAAHDEFIRANELHLRQMIEDQDFEDFPDEDRTPRGALTHLTAGTLATLEFAADGLDLDSPGTLT